MSTPVESRRAGILAGVGVIAVLAASPIARGQGPGAATLPPGPAAGSLNDLRVPPGFGITVFAADLQGARMMAVSPEGTLHLARRSDVVALPDSDHDGRAEPRVVLS